MSVNNTWFIQQSLHSIRECCAGMGIGYPADILEVEQGCLEVPLVESQATSIVQHLNRIDEPNFYIKERSRRRGNPAFHQHGRMKSRCLGPHDIMPIWIMGLISGGWRGRHGVITLIFNLIVVAIAILTISGTAGRWTHNNLKLLKESKERMVNLTESQNSLRASTPESTEGRIKASIDKALVLEKRYRRLQKIKVAAAFMLTIGAVIFTIGILIATVMSVSGASPAALMMFSIVAGGASIGMVVASFVMITGRFFAMGKRKHIKLACETLLPLSELALARSREATLQRNRH